MPNICGACRYLARLPDTLGRDGRLGCRRTLGTITQDWTGILRLDYVSAPFPFQRATPSLVAFAAVISMQKDAPVAQVWDLALVLETDHHHHHVDSKLKTHLDLFAVEVSSCRVHAVQNPVEPLPACSDAVGALPLRA